MAKVDFTQTKKDFKEINKGLKDQISYADELGKLKNKYNKANEREKDILSDVLDRTKDIFKNRKELANEQLTSVDLHKLERRLIAEGLEDQVKMVQRLKEEDRIQKQINRTINAQAKVYNNIGSSIDSFVRKIPGGGLLGDLLGTGDLGKEMSESFRTSISGGGFGEFGKNVGGEFLGGFGNSLLLASGAGKSRNALSRFVLGGPAVALAGAAALGVIVSKGMENGLESVGVANTFKRFVFRGSFEGLKDAFGNLGQADFGTLLSMRLNRFRFGIAEKDQAKILAAQINISGASKQTALNIQSTLAKSASMRGVLPEDVFADIASNTENFAAFAKDGGQNIGEAAIRARELGVSLDTVFKVSDSILDFQSSIENELKASLLIGRQLNLNEARRLAMAGDMAGLQEEILRQVGSEEELQRMNAIQRKSLAGALGVTVSELNKLASGELEVKNSDMKQNTDAMRALTVVMAGAVIAFASRLALIGGRSALAYMRRQPGVAANVTRSANFANTGRYVIEGRAGSFGSRKAAEATAKSLMANPAKLSGTVARGAFGGPVGVGLTIVTLLSTLVPVLRKIRGNTEDTATNTKKSITGKNFSTPLYSSTVMQSNIGNE